MQAQGGAEVNTLTVKINGIDYSKKITYPYKWADLLDEQLDEANLFLKNLRIGQPFSPLTEVEITITNAPESKQVKVKNTTRTDIVQTLENNRLTQVYSKTFIVAIDTVYEYPVGSGLYTHELYLIERTKLLEGFIGDSITFTNALGNDFVGINT